MRECDASKLARAAGQGLIPIPTVGDAYFMYPQRWAPLVLAHGAVLLGRGGISWLRAHVRSSRMCVCKCTGAKMTHTCIPFFVCFKLCPKNFTSLAIALLDRGEKKILDSKYNLQLTYLG